MKLQGEIEKADASCWEYRGEGNASLVVANQKVIKAFDLNQSFRLKGSWESIQA